MPWWERLFRRGATALFSAFFASLRSNGRSGNGTGTVKSPRFAPHPAAGTGDSSAVPRRVESTAFPNGEIGGHFTLANGSQTFTPPPAPPAWTDDSADPNAAVRFLTQATFGASANDLAAVQSLGYAGWLASQFSMPATHGLTNVLAHPYSDPTDSYQSPLWFNTWWQQSITAPDQLRQRVAFALSEIFVVSENGTLQNHADALASCYDMLIDHAFGNFRALLEAVTLHPAMGLYLSMLGNDKGSSITGLHANENYAREVQQLFSIGLNRLWPDGTLILDSQDNLVPTYGQNEVMGFASVFTGWNYYQTNQANGRLPANWYPRANYTNPMVLVPAHHELGAKLVYVYRLAQVFNDDGTGVRGNLQAVIQAILLDYQARSPDLISQPAYGKQREPLLRVTALARAMEQLGLSNHVTCFAASDFGRTFPSNGQGSDHGWGSHHLILGGAVKGQRTYGQFPALTVNGPDDTNTGRWIPTTAIDQYFATLATWFGVDSGNLSTVFPNFWKT
jgi:hypothetical protein